MNLFDFLKRQRRRRLRVLVCGHPVLRERALPIAAVTPEIRQLAERMIVTMFENEVVGVGLAAPQVGVGLRLITLATHDPRQSVTPEASPGELLLGPRMPLALVNPEIVWSSPESATASEGCLSIPDISGPVERPARIIVRASTLDGEQLAVECAGLLSRCIQHEIDHLNGVLFVDRVVGPERDAVTAEFQELEQRVRSRLKPDVAAG